MQTNADTKGAMPSLNDIISPDSQVEPGQVSYQKITTTQTSQPGGQTNYTYTRKVQEVGNPNIGPIEEEAETTQVITTKEETYQQPVTETTYYAKKVTTKTTTTTSGRGNEPTTTQTTSKRYSNTNANKNPTSSYTRPGQTTTTTTTSTTVQRGQYGQGKGTPTTNTTSQVYRGNQRNVQPPTKIGTSQSYSGNRYQPKRPEEPASYKPKAKSPEPGTLKRKTINRGDPVQNIQITHIIYSSRPAEFHITEKLNLDNLNSEPITISKADRARLQKSGKVTSTCSCDGVEIAQPKKFNLKGNTTHYQHARGIGMTNDDRKDINPMFYSSEIKKLDPIHREKEKEKVEIVEIFRSSGQTKSKSPAVSKTTKKTTTSTTYNRGGASKYNQNQNYRSGATTSNRGGVASSTSNRGGATNTASNRGGAGTTTTVKTTTSYTRGSGGGKDGEIIKETNTKVQMGSRSFKNQSQPTTYTTHERKVYNQNSFFNK
jgi:hypothetical protein